MHSNDELRFSGQQQRRGQTVTFLLEATHVWSVKKRLLTNQKHFTVPLTQFNLTCHLDWDSDRPTDSSILQPHYSATNLWNSLPAHLTLAPSLTVCRQCLKTFLFRHSYPDIIAWHSELTFCCGPSSRPNRVFNPLTPTVAIWVQLV